MSRREILADNLDLAVEALRRDGFRLDVIYPADEPNVATLSRCDERVTVRTPDAPAMPDGLPAFRPEFILTRSGAESGAGRAGMLYRDLIPGRLGGRYIASQITINEGGPVSDWVHYHNIAVQLIVVRGGWVKVVYEDQGDPFVMRAGDLVLQPPLIRHRVLESSPGLEVVEVSAPALHETFADHDLELPNGPARTHNFSGQRFVRHFAEEASWTQFLGGEAQVTGVSDATNGAAEALVIRRAAAPEIHFGAHGGELMFGFVLEGTASLHSHGIHALGPTDAFVIPPDGAWSLSEMSAEFRLLYVTTARLDCLAASPL